MYIYLRQVVNDMVSMVFCRDSVVGIVLTNGPLYISKVWFDGFSDANDEGKSAAAMSWSTQDPSPILWVSDAEFGFDDSV